MHTKFMQFLRHECQCEFVIVRQSGCGITFCGYKNAYVHTRVAGTSETDFTLGCQRRWWKRMLCTEWIHMRTTLIHFSRKKKFIPRKLPLAFISDAVERLQSALFLQVSSVGNIRAFSCLIPKWVFVRQARWRCECVRGLRVMYSTLLLDGHSVRCDAKHDLISIWLVFSLLCAHSSLTDKHRISSLIYYVIHGWPGAIALMKISIKINKQSNRYVQSNVIRP